MITDKNDYGASLLQRFAWETVQFQRQLETTPPLKMAPFILHSLALSPSSLIGGQSWVWQHYGTPFSLDVVEEQEQKDDDDDENIDPKLRTLCRRQ